MLCLYQTGKCLSNQLSQPFVLCYLDTIYSCMHIIYCYFSNKLRLCKVFIHKITVSMLSHTLFICLLILYCCGLSLRSHIEVYTLIELLQYIVQVTKFKHSSWHYKLRYWQQTLHFNNMTCGKVLWIEYSTHFIVKHIMIR